MYCAYAAIPPSLKKERINPRRVGAAHSVDSEASALGHLIKPNTYSSQFALYNYYFRTTVLLTFLQPGNNMRPDTPPPSRQTGFQTGYSLQHNSPYSLIYEEYENLPTVKPQKTVLKSNASTNAVLDARLKAKVAEALAVEDEQEAPPDGGCLAWSIVFASFMVSFLQVYLSYCMLRRRGVYWGGGGA